LNETIQVVKPAVGNEKNFLKSLINHNNFELSIFNVDKASLDNNGWILRDNKERSILDKIKNKCEVNLKQICESYQGIVTGCDKAFIVNEEDIAKECLEKDIIKPWIKSSFIKKFKVNRMDSYIIYSNLIQQEENYINCIRHIKTHKDKLIERRECKNGVRKWYELQWGRAFDIFEKQKIIFPYKASNNKFAIDIGSYFSADIYCLVLKEEASYTYEFLCSVLNSKVYEYYLKSFAKKLGESLYEYYPNTIMKLNIPQMMYISENIDDFLYKYFDFDEGEIAIINSYIKG
jgi:adenine-specific DNA-methyltransferase